MNKMPQFLIYSAPQTDVKIEVVVKNETIWLTQKAMATLFDVQIPAINKHLFNIYNERELERESTISKMEMVQNEGGKKVTRKVHFYLNKTQRDVSNFDRKIQKIMSREGNKK